MTYEGLLNKIMISGVDVENRTTVPSRMLWGEKLEYDLLNGFPAITSRKVSFRIAFEEAMFFVRGKTQTKELEKKNIYIWKEHTSREFLNSRNLTYLPEGDMGKGYGYQMRNFNGNHHYNISYDSLDGHMFQDEIACNEVSCRGGFDQLAALVHGLKSDPTSRRHIISLWNPMQLNEMALPPCHILNQYQIVNNRLYSIFYMRSSDVPYGLPYNLMYYSFINVALSKLLNISPGKVVYFGANVHIYHNQFDMVKEQLARTEVQLPSLVITKELNTLDDLLSLEYSDMNLLNYSPHPDIKNKPKMAI